jgi:predicted transcriptional regulator
MCESTKPVKVARVSPSTVRRAPIRQRAADQPSEGVELALCVVAITGSRDHAGAVAHDQSSRRRPSQVAGRDRAVVDLSTLRSWTFLTKHADVFLALARESTMRIPEIAIAAAITERSTYRILADLEHAGYVRRRKEGRRNHYELRVDLPLGEPLVEDGFLRDLVAVIQAGEPRAGATRGCPGNT